MSFVLQSYDLGAAKPEQAFLKREPFGITYGERVEKITFGDVDGTTGHGLKVSVLTYGATIQSVKHRRASGGGFQELTLGYDNLQAYVDDTTYMGATVGRYANRIRDGKFELPGLTTSEDDCIPVQLLTNEGLNTLHGGPQNFSKAMWKIRRLITPDQMEGEYVGVVLGLTSFDGDQGFPGTIEVEAHFLVRVRHGELKVRYYAKLLEGIATVCSLTNHTYWNLSGAVDPSSSSSPPSRARSFSGSLDQSPVVPEIHPPTPPVAAADKPPLSPPPSTTPTASPASPGTNLPRVVPTIENHYVKLKSDFYLTTMPGEPLPDGGVARIRNGPVQSLAMLSSETTFGTVNGLLQAEAQDEAEPTSPIRREPLSRSVAADSNGSPVGISAASRSTSRRQLRKHVVVNTLPALDHCFVIRGTPGTLRPAARVWDTKSGRQVRVWTTLPSVQVYTGNHLKEQTKGRGESVFGPRSGFSLETQMFPDAPNHPHFPSTLLRKGEAFDHETLWVFD